MEHKAILGIVVASSFLGFSLLCFICIRYYCRRRKRQEVSRYFDATSQRARYFDAARQRATLQGNFHAALQGATLQGSCDSRDLSSGCTGRLQIEDLQQATDTFSADNIIGSSKISIVYKGVVDNDLSRYTKGIQTVAIKVLKIEYSMEVERFFNEVVHVVGRIKHPNLSNVLGFCWPRNNFMALLTEFMPKRDLGGVIHGEVALDLTKRLDIAISTAQALQFLHDICSPKIVHCHLKPTNILLDNNYNARVTDFGTAHMLWPYLQQEREAISSGLSYIAPELGQRKVAVVEGGRLFSTVKMVGLSPKADVYSFGVVMMELLSRRRAGVSVVCEGGERMRLREWIESGMKGGSIVSLVDSRLNLNVSEREVEKMGHLLNISLVCTKETAEERPNMSQVLHWLINIKQDTMESNLGYESS